MPISCMGMESFGLPCPHIVVVLVHKDVEELPSSLVLNRWCKTAKEGFSGRVALEGAYDNVKSPTNDGILRNPGVMRTKGCRSLAKVGPRERRRVQTCSTCKSQGHNKSTCELCNNPILDEEAEINGLCGGGGDELNEVTKEGT
ncbi:hypothetical protein RIF29_28724 [Crotalaria pallida]|uniref:SWIM-type domain-containing protein n=1 Tax=Crotalaria pallida TaxID=3830 RepID=A0AAN9ED62_CROPI